MPKIKFAGAALNQIPFNWSHNKKNIISAIETARRDKADLLVLPELCITGYGMQDMFFHSWVSTKALGVVEEIIPETKGIMVTLGIPFNYKGDLYNVVVIVKDGRIAGISAKQNLANDGVHYEHRWFKEWPEGKRVSISLFGQEIDFGDVRYSIKDCKLGVEICEDAWRVERPACKMYEDGTEIIINSSASHFGFGKTEFREELVRSSSEKFNCTYIFTNMLGNESGRMIYEGDILMASNGKLIARSEVMSYKEVNYVSTEIDPKNPDRISEISASQYSKNELFTAAVTLGLVDYWRKSGTKGFVLSLSGGADSSACAVLVAESVKRGVQEFGVEGFCSKMNMPILTSERDIVKSVLYCVYQSTNNSTTETYQSAKNLAESIGASFSRWSVQEEVDSITKKLGSALQKEYTWESDDIALQNIQARMRSPGIWMLANTLGCLLLTTSNRSEGDVGYTTMDGDSSGSLAPIAGVDKHFIRQWLVWAESELGYKGLNAVNSLKPTAELRPGSTQTDEDDLMPYSLMVEIERLAVKEGYSPLQTYMVLRDESEFESGLLKTFIARFYKLLGQNQWKRERTAPSFHLDDFNIDPKTWFRFPILSGNFKEEIDLLMSNN